MIPSAPAGFRGEARMGLFSNLFNRRDREIAELMNPLLAMKLREFVIADDDPNYVKHYFKFRNKEGQDEEFITVYRRVGSQLEYLRTMSRRAVWGPEFQTLSERGPWSMTITHLIEQGKQLSANTRPTRGHFASKFGPLTSSQPRKPEARPVTETPSPLGMDAIKASFANEVRKQPKGYAVWMQEQNPGEFIVLLVKLDSDGSMADGWSLGTFRSRKEQGAFALEVARELQISLSDVVPPSSQDSTASTSPALTYSVAKIDNQTLPPSSGTIWLDGDEIWFSQPSKDFSINGHSYHIPGGATCFPREGIGREVLLGVLRKERDLWAPGDEAEVKARIKQLQRFRVD
jgi:hypothetical protein